MSAFILHPSGLLFSFRPSARPLRTGLCRKYLSLSSLCALVFPDGWFYPVFLPQPKNTNIILTELSSSAPVDGVCGVCVCVACVTCAVTMLVCWVSARWPSAPWILSWAEGVFNDPGSQRPGSRV